MIEHAMAVKSAENEQILAIEYVPIQQSSFENIFDLEDALLKGTVFPELYLPFCKEGEPR